jgi:4-amino-4-deoxy-L-arabinose transferase-like glycosyltransferase
MLAGEGYSLKLAWGGSKVPTAHMPPGLPFVLAGLYWLDLANPHLAFQLIQVVAAALSLVLVWLLGREAFSEPAAWAASILYVLDLNLSFTVTWVQETALNIFFVLAGVWFTVRAQRDLTNRSAVLAGISFGLGALVRPVILLIMAVSLVWWVIHRAEPLRGWLRKAIVMCAVVGVIIAPWTIRNLVVFQRFVPICQNWAINFWLGYNSEAAGSQCRADGSILVPTGELADRLRQATSEDEIDRLLSEDAWSYLRQHPIDALALRPFCFLYFWLDHNYWIDPPPYSVSRLVRWSNFALVGLTAAGVLLHWRRPGVARLLLLILISISLFYTVFHADIGNRFRMQIEPIMLIYAGQLLTCVRPRIL